MTKVSTTEMTEYSTIGFIVLKGRIDCTLVQSAREAVAEKIEALRSTVKGEDVFTTVCQDTDWPNECKTLFEAVENSVPPASFCPPGVKIRILSRIGVFQPSNLIRGRAAPKAVFYTIPLNVGALVSGVNMPSYYPGSYIENSPLKLVSEGLRVEEGDILVWNGNTILENANTQNSGFMLIKHFWE